MTLITTPAPTVLPPSLSAKRSPSAMGTGYMSSMVKVALSPGTTCHAKHKPSVTNTFTVHKSSSDR